METNLFNYLGDKNSFNEAVKMRKRDNVGLFGRETVKVGDKILDFGMKKMGGKAAEILEREIEKARVKIPVAQENALIDHMMEMAEGKYVEHNEKGQGKFIGLLNRMNLTPVPYCSEETRDGVQVMVSMLGDRVESSELEADMTNIFKRKELMEEYIVKELEARLHMKAKQCITELREAVQEGKRNHKKHSLEICVSHNLNHKMFFTTKNVPEVVLQTRTKRGAS
jgi:hypothetical protein